ncbi:MAG: hypothetical protein RIT81_43040 [Deltaproteobacteria bacterium]
MDEDETMDEYDGLMTLDEDDPTVRGEILKAGAVAHEEETELGGAREAARAGRDDRLRAIARRLIRRLERE